MPVIRLTVFLICCAAVFAQRNTGELRLSVVDPSGGAIQARGRLESQSAGVNRAFETTPEGGFVLRVLPFGEYKVEVARDGFASRTKWIDIHSEHPIDLTVELGVAAIETTLQIGEPGTLVDPARTGAIEQVGQDALQHRLAAAPGRGVLDMVSGQPGWLLEANGVLHPRGSEYQVQYVIDGIPITDNRSPGFAQSLGIEEFESMAIRTGNFPAEYGRKLGGVIEVTTERDKREGFHGKVSLQGGSFATAAGYAAMQYAWRKTTVGISGEGMSTDRYLDAPVEENFTNHGSGGGAAAHADHDWSPSDRTRVYVHRNRTAFLVPNERLQEGAGQRQDRASEETLSHISHQHIFSPNVLASARVMARDTSADLWSNSLTLPILPMQNRGFREVYANGAVSATYRGHELKAGGEFISANIHEDFSYRITAYRVGGIRIFDRDLPADFHFQDRGNSREQGAYLQDLWRFRKLTISAGIRFDRYRMVARESAWSPRFGAAYALGDFVLRASYDRTFETPAIENILLASSDLTETLGGGAFVLVRPARGNYFEAGFSKGLRNRLRLDASYYRRSIRNFQDDSVLLNTGVSFPIAFSRGEIHGVEAKLSAPRIGPLSAFVSYSNLTGRGYTPVSGGLFLGDDSAAAFDSNGSFPITQDQRNAVRTQARVQLDPRLWVTAAARYNSGLPVELEGPVNPAQYGQRILQRVNFERGRVRPSAALDFSAGADIWKREGRSVQLIADLLNATNRLNVINFAGLFSGTAIEAPRSFAVRLKATF